MSLDTFFAVIEVQENCLATSPAVDYDVERMRPFICNTHRYFGCVCIAANLVFSVIAFTTYASDKKPEPSPLNAGISIVRQLVTDITRSAKQGDSELQQLLTRFDLNADMDWEAMQKRNPEKGEQILEGVCKALVTLADHNER